jgi:hypothetical protein
MPDDNRISITLPDSDKQDVLDAIKTIHDKLPFLLNLADDERIALPKMGDASLAFDEKCATYMTTLPSLVPGFVDVSEVAKDRLLRAQLGEIDRELAALSRSVTDTLMLASSELWMADLSFYQNVRLASKRGINGSQAAYADLSARFPANPKTKTKANGSTPA